jgi:hypothetical protein
LFKPGRSPPVRQRGSLTGPRFLGRLHHYDLGLQVLGPHDHRLLRQHTPHDLIAENKRVRHGGRDVGADHEQQRPCQGPVPFADRIWEQRAFGDDVLAARSPAPLGRQNLQSVSAAPGRDAFLFS